MPVAIEIQRSNMTVQDVYDRTVARHKNGLSVIWVIPSINQLKIFKEDNQDVCRVPKVAWSVFMPWDLDAYMFGQAIGNMLFLYILANLPAMFMKHIFIILMVNI